MPIIKSAKKRVRVAEKATIRNAKTRRSVKTALKAFGKSPSAKSFNSAQSEIAKAGKKHVYHKNKVARKQRQLAAAAKSAKVKPAASAKKTASKPASKPTTAKNPAAKKSAPAKKPAAKKTPAKKQAPKKK